MNDKTELVQPELNEETTPKPRTEAQRQAAARNGAKSRGPITPAGKAKSARNRFRHHTLAKSILFADESLPEFNDAIESLHDMFRPQDPFEASLVEMMAVASWRQTRLLEMERAGIKIQALPEHAVAYEPAAKAFLACQILNRDLETLHRQAARLDRQYHNALQRLIEHRRNRDREFEKPGPQGL